MEELSEMEELPVSPGKFDAANALGRIGILRFWPPLAPISNGHGTAEAVET
jgi:hypothetical protein